MYDKGIVGTSRDYKDEYKKLNCWTKLVENFAVFPQEAETKYKNITTGYGVDSTSKAKNLFLDVVLGQRGFADLSGFQFS